LEHSEDLDSINHSSHVMSPCLLRCKKLRYASVSSLCRLSSPNSGLPKSTPWTKMTLLMNDTDNESSLRQSYDPADATDNGCSVDSGALSRAHANQNT
jgi:hypothetical protein